MDFMGLKRRSVLLGLGGLGVSQMLTRAAAQSTTSEVQAAGAARVLADGEGEQLVHFRDGGKIVIKIGAAEGSENLSLGTQQVTAGAGIPVHRHPRADEAFYVLSGSGVVLLNDQPHAIGQGATVFIPRNTWHGFRNPDHELVLYWIMTPPGLDGFFRTTCSAPGAPPKKLSPEQIRAIALQYGTEFR